MAIFTGTVFLSLKETLDAVHMDKMDGLEAGLLYKKYCELKKQKDHYDDETEMAGPGLASEKPEGQEMNTGTIFQGPVVRYIARTWALKMNITEETMEDNKYPEVINLARYNKRAMLKTQDIDAALMLVRGFNTGYPGFDGVPLWSASHTLPSGGTYSNVMTVPTAPSRAAVIDAQTAVSKFPGRDGLLGDDYQIKKIVCPVDQKFVWLGIIKSTHAPEPGNFNEINVVNSEFDLDLVPVVHWANTTTSYAFLTDADGGMNFRTKRKPRTNSWVENSQEVMTHSISARWARGWGNGRSTLGVQA
jgi:hypothetical protein